MATLLTTGYTASHHKPHLARQNNRPPRLFGGSSRDKLFQRANRGLQWLVVGGSVMLVSLPAFLLSPLVTAGVAGAGLLIVIGGGLATWHDYKAYPWGLR